MKTHHAVIKTSTKEKHQFIDLTAEIKEIVRDSKIGNGVVNIVSRHTTTALLLNENETLLLRDFLRELRRILPAESDTTRYSNNYYEHDNMEERRKTSPHLSCNECKNGDSHCRSIFLTNSQTLNVVNGELDLGRWQSVIFWELDLGKDREISVMVMGEEKKNFSPDNFIAYWPGC